MFVCFSHFLALVCLLPLLIFFTSMSHFLPSLLCTFAPLRSDRAGVGRGGRGQVHAPGQAPLAGPERHAHLPGESVFSALCVYFVVRLCWVVVCYCFFFCWFFVHVGLGQGRQLLAVTFSRVALKTFTFVLSHSPFLPFSLSSSN